MAKDIRLIKVDLETRNKIMQERYRCGYPSVNDMLRERFGLQPKASNPLTTPLEKTKKRGIL